MQQETEAFLRYLATQKNFSTNTLAAYRNDLSQMADFFREKGAGQWGDIDRQLVLSYLLDLKQRGYALTTVARKTASAKTMFRFLVNEGIIRTSPTDNVGSPRVKKNLPHPLPESQVRELLRQPDKYPTPEARRDKAMLELLYASGMKISELMSLDVGDVDFNGDCVRCTLRGSRERNTSLSSSSVPAFRRYLEEARPQLMHHRGEKALFLNRLGQRLTRQGFWQIVKTYAREARLDNQITLRTLRHSFAASSTDMKVRG